MRIHRPYRAVARGMTMVELMVSLTLSVMVMGAATQMYISSKTGYMTERHVAWLQENARFALHKLGYDLRMAGFVGDLQEYWALGEANDVANKARAVSGECFTLATTGQEFRWLFPMVYHDDLTPINSAPKLLIENNSATNFANCITAGTGLEQYRAGTDVVSSHYLDPGGVVLDSGLTNGDIFARVDMKDGVVFQCQVAGSACAAPDKPEVGTNYPVVAVAYYVSSCGRPGDDGQCGTADDIPSLMRVRLWRGGTLSRERVADGVVDLQVQYGADTNGDGLPNAYLDSQNGFLDPASWQVWSTMKAARVWLLLRVSEPGYTDPKSSYTYGDATTVPAAGYRYELFTTTLTIRNQYSTGPET